MLNGLLARKIGMTQIFEEDGTALPVTMLKSGPMTVVQKKTLEKEGCNHVQVGFEVIAERKVNKPIKGHFKTQTPTRFLRDFEVENIDEVEIGQVFDVNLFAEGESIAVSKGAREAIEKAGGKVVEAGAKAEARPVKKAKADPKKKPALKKEAKAEEAKDEASSEDSTDAEEQTEDKKDEE